MEITSQLMVNYFQMGLVQDHAIPFLHFLTHCFWKGWSYAFQSLPFLQLQDVHVVLRFVLYLLIEYLW